MRRLTLGPENWLRRYWPVASILFILLFMGHSVALASEVHASNTAPTTASPFTVSVTDDLLPQTNKSEHSCDTDHGTHFVSSQNRLDSLDIADAAERPMAPPAGASAAELFSVLPLFGTLLRTLLQVYLN